MVSEPSFHISSKTRSLKSRKSFPSCRMLSHESTTKTCWLHSLSYWLLHCQGISRGALPVSQPLRQEGLDTSLDYVAKFQPGMAFIVSPWVSSQGFCFLKRLGVIHRPQKMSTGWLSSFTEPRFRQFLTIFSFSALIVCFFWTSLCGFIYLFIYLLRTGL